MENPHAAANKPAGIRNAVGFWEPRRIWYNAVLIVIVILWLVLT